MTAKQRDRIVRAAIRPRYSSELSRDFWARINILPDDLRWRLYSLACLLQNAESVVISELERAEKDCDAARKGKKR